MNVTRIDDARAILNSFLRHDRHYLASSTIYGDKGPKALNRAIKLFLNHPELGFVWLAYEKKRPIGVCVVCYAISTSIGGLVAKLDDVFVTQDKRGHGVATNMLSELASKLKRRSILRIDTAVYKGNRRAEKYYQHLGFKSLCEERLSLVL